MNKLARKRRDFQKLRGTIKRLNRLMKRIGRQSPGRIAFLVRVELNHVELKLKTVQTGIVRELLTKFSIELRRLAFEASGNKKELGKFQLPKPSFPLNK